MAWERNNDGKVLMWGRLWTRQVFQGWGQCKGDGMATTEWGGGFPHTGCIWASWTSGNRGYSSVPEEGPSFPILGDVGGSHPEGV